MKFWITHQPEYWNAWQLDVVWTVGKFRGCEQTFYRHTSGDLMRCLEFIAGIGPVDDRTAIN